MNSELMKIEERATKIFLEKPYWAKKYVNAPEGEKEYYRLMFANSVWAFAKGDAECSMECVYEERDRIYTTMDDESWDYVLHNACHAEALGLYVVRKYMQGQIGKKCGYWLPRRKES